MSAKSAPPRRDGDAANATAVQAVAARLAAAGQSVLWAAWPAPGHVGCFTTMRPALQAAATTPDAPAREGDGRTLRATEHELARYLPAEPVWLRQVHGAQVAILDAAALAAARATPPVADASVTRLPGVVCAVRTADCLPVALADRAGTAIGIAHAGWRGLAAGVLEATVDALTAQGVAAREFIAWLGPAIGPAAYEVGADVHHAFCASDAGAAACFVPHGEGKWLADLFGLARRRLAAAGVTSVYGGGLCTYTDAQRFPSYRRERTGDRMATLLWLGPAPRGPRL